MPAVSKLQLLAVLATLGPFGLPVTGHAFGTKPLETPTVEAADDTDSVCCCESSGGTLGAQCCAVGAIHHMRKKNECSKFGITTCSTSWCSNK